MAERVDAHQHFWNYVPAEYGWIDDSMERLRRDFLPPELEQQMAAANIGGVISVQARQSLTETKWLLKFAEALPWIRGVVGWAPIAEGGFRDELESLRLHPRLKGLRHVLQDEADPEFMLREDFNAGIDALQDTGLAYDLLILERQLPTVIEFVDRHPNQIFVLDHLAKPLIAAGTLEPWRTNLRRLAEREHVYCKLSGMATEAGWESWSVEDLGPYVSVALDCFGPKRLMAGSDWPVCTLATTYGRWFETLEQLLGCLSPDENDRIFGETAVEVYGLGLRHEKS